MTTDSEVAMLEGAAQPWRPIETAPKDGTWIMLVVGNGVRFGCYGPKESRHGVNYGDDWGWGRSWDNRFDTAPTHWMPLP